MMRKPIHVYAVTLAVILMGSCVPIKKLKYLQDEQGDIGQRSFNNSRDSKKVEAFDKLYIRIYSLEEEVSDIFEINTYTISQENINIFSYTVNEKGIINFPFVGAIEVIDLTIEEVKEKIEKLLKRYLNDISVNVRFVGNKVVVLGEVNRPGEYVFYDDKISVLQALSLAEGIGDYGNKKTIKLIREQDDKILMIPLDLTDQSILLSPYYFLHPNDVIVVEPIRAKYQQVMNFQFFAIMLTSVTTLVSVLSYLKN